MMGDRKRWRERKSEKEERENQANPYCWHALIMLFKANFKQSSD